MEPIVSIDNSHCLIGISTKVPFFSSKTPEETFGGNPHHSAIVDIKQQSEPLADKKEPSG